MNGLASMPLCLSACTAPIARHTARSASASASANWSSSFMGALLGLAGVRTASVVQGQGAHPSPSLHATQQAPNPCAEGAWLARGMCLGLLSSAHCSSFNTALYAAESFCAVFANCVKSLRRNVRKARAEGSGFEVSMASIVFGTH